MKTDLPSGHPNPAQVEAEARAVVAHMLPILQQAGSKTCCLTHFVNEADWRLVMREVRASQSWEYQKLLDQYIMQQLLNHGVAVNRITIFPGPYFQWLLDHGLPNNPAHRMQYCASRTDAKYQVKPDPLSQN